MAMLVVWSHSFALWYKSESREWLSLLMGGTYNAGNIGVLAFFVISGFLITGSFINSKSAISYLKRRITRIYPGYLVAVTICSLVIVPMFSSWQVSHLSKQQVAGLLSNIFLRNYIIASNAFGGGAVNGSLWSIRYEFWCYLGVMALGMAGFLRWKPSFVIIAIVVMVIRVWLDITGRRPGGGFLEPIIGFAYLWFTVLPPFALGAGIFMYRKSIPRCRWMVIGLIAGTLVAAHLPAALGVPLTRLLLPVSLSYTMLYLAFSKRAQFHNFAKYGDFSFGTYLYAFPIQQMLAVIMRGRADFAPYVICSMLASLFAGVLSWHLVERWFAGKIGHSSAPRQSNLASKSVSGST